MLISELLLEKHVESTWITDLIHNRPNRKVTMRLSNGRTFSILGITRTVFDSWNKAPSKGQYWHKFIKNKHNVTRIK